MTKEEIRLNVEAWELACASFGNISRVYRQTEREREDTRWELMKSFTQAARLGIINKRELAILRFRFGKKKTLEETGRMFDVTRERIRSLEEEAIRKMKNVDVQFLANE